MKAGNPRNDSKIELTGKVVKKKFAKGSKSEHIAVYLKTTDASYLLRRLGGNPFVDPELQKLVGKKVKAMGILTPSFFMAHDFEMIS